MITSTGLLQSCQSRVVPVRGRSTGTRASYSHTELNKQAAQPVRWGEKDFEPYQASILMIYSNLSNSTLAPFLYLRLHLTANIV